MNRIESKEKRQLAIDFCKEHPDMGNMTIARILYKQRPELWPNIEAARLSVRFVRGSQGKKSRHATAPKLPPSPLSTGENYNWQFPESMATEWKPFIIEGVKKIGILGDLHIPFHDPKAVHTAIEYFKRVGVDCILLNGDVFDFFSISRFDKDPTTAKLVDELWLGREFLGWLGNQFPKARIIFKEGNHDERFAHYMWRKCPELLGLKSLMLQSLCTDTNVISKREQPAIRIDDWVCDQRIIKAGTLDIMHGHEAGKGISSPVNPARGIFLRTLENTFCNHYHRSSKHEEKTSKNKLVSCRSGGCLCYMYPEYARINKWNQGLCVVELDGNDFHMDERSIADGRVY